MPSVGGGPGSVPGGWWKRSVTDPVGATGSGVRRPSVLGGVPPTGDSQAVIVTDDVEPKVNRRSRVPGRGEGRHPKPSPRPAEPSREFRPFRWRAVRSEQSMSGIHTTGDVVQIKEDFSGATFISVFDRDQTLFGVRPLQPPQQLSVAHARARPAMLLGGERGVTRFVDRDQEMTTLTAWYDQPMRLSVMLVHGTGGQGKTRLMREFATSVSGRPERSQVLEALPFTEVPVEVTSSDADEPDAESTRPREILLLVDEADLWPTHKLKQLFREVTAQPFNRVRVILTARAAGMWWSDLRAELQPLEFWCRWFLLKPLDAAGIRELAENAGECFAAAVEWSEPPPLPQEVLDELADGPPLSAELIVLARTHANQSGHAVPDQLQAAIEVILEKELRYWARLYGMEDSGAGEDPHRIHLQLGFMARVVYVATLTGPLGHNEAQLVLRLARIGCALDTQQVIDDHARCYPPPDGNLWLAPLAPCVAEEFLGMLVPDPKREACFIAEDSWATDAPFHVLDLMSPEERATEAFEREGLAKARVSVPSAADEYGVHTFGPQLERVIVRLVRAASKHPHLADQQLYPLAELYPKAVVAAGKTALIELSELRPGPRDDVRKKLAATAGDYDLAAYQQAIDALRRLAISPGPDTPPADSNAAEYGRSQGTVSAPISPRRTTNTRATHQTCDGEPLIRR